jgi:hypothetical protein
VIVISWRSLALGCLAVLTLAAVTFWAALPKLSCPGIPSTEFAAIAALRTYLAAQRQFHRTEGRLASWTELARLGLIDQAMAEATSSENPRAGYYFVEIEPEGEMRMGLCMDLCAVPARYPKTGRNTFIIDVTGTVYRKDTGGKPVTVWPDVSDGWLPIGAE